ncbi:hypothetical protein D9611_009223 [Ephemerocybe angulata]|uniref:Uncharacterized protein n=1 Tax=Ephemerocybe angulata TaxID=980116 RepID=A0A8H5F452_9AGAR|nr:hypothetical protein D9611_009223 [Tulosesus angulatus]
MNLSKSVHRLPAPAKIAGPGLNNLPKSPRPRGVIFRGQTPGNATKLIAPHVNTAVLDPGHPAVRAGGRDMKGQYVKWEAPGGAWRVVAGPKAFLGPPETRVEPGFGSGVMWGRWEGRARGTGVSEGGGGSVEGREREEGGEDLGELEGAMGRYVKRRREVVGKGVPMSLQFATAKAKMGGKPFYASTVKKRVRAAVSMVVNQGARVVREGEGEKVVFDLEEVRGMVDVGWVMRDWTYVVFPTMRLYRMPYTELIPDIRAALSYVRKEALKIEESWTRPPKQSPRQTSPGAKKAKPQRRPPPARP